ncbi:nucleotide sugar epimerase [Oceanicola sp. 22II-s10i]|uniref:polysaccharide biosynthesis protein n=1 Tax=Oceanicola sp. 22II-s10i TaxID=1317116 RepID=UPI000B526F62|nr:nucleoside-diphosphate sugar epimerase/dehydratase [Oceanicola sp. 22II-s10i]OWU85809.1 nucleotide sugar epimerase [Oceanicola sp. 22II-s10i]
MLFEWAIKLDAWHKRLILISVDAFLVLVALSVVAILVPSNATGLYIDWRVAATCLATGVGMTIYLELDRKKLLAYEANGITDTAILALAIGAACGLSNFIPGVHVTLLEVVITTMAFMILSVGARLGMLHTLKWIYMRRGHRRRILIYGAGQTGRQLAAALTTDDAVVPVAFVDDNPRLQSLTISGLRVHSPLHIKEIVKRNSVDRIILAMPSEGRAVQARISRRLREVGCEVQSLPSFAQMVAQQGFGHQNVLTFDIQEILGRNRLEEELPGISDAYGGKNILVTGAGGSIGSELCRQLTACGPKRLVLLDHSELALYNIERELAELEPDFQVIPVLGSICEKSLVVSVMAENEIDVVLHAAAYKHLPMVQTNAIEGLRNNVLGTKIVADAAGEVGVERFVLISSDKAVRPSSIMGSTKRLAEEIVQDLATRSRRTRYSMVRFGNVIGSSGSVIPLFEEQIARGGPVTVTDPRVTRFFMTVSEAVRLVLSADSFARGGDVFVLDMGEPVPIYQVARQMIEGAGYSVRDENNPNGEIAIEITGLRPGEKLHEELLIGSDMLTTPHPKILRAQEKHLSEIEMAAALNEIRKAVESRDAPGAEAAMCRWVEEYKGESVSAVG